MSCPECTCLPYLRHLRRRPGRFEVKTIVVAICFEGREQVADLAVDQLVQLHLGAGPEGVLDHLLQLILVVGPRGGQPAVHGGVKPQVIQIEIRRARWLDDKIHPRGVLSTHLVYGRERFLGPVGWGTVHLHRHLSVQVVELLGESDHDRVAINDFPAAKQRSNTRARFDQDS